MKLIVKKEQIFGCRLSFYLIENYNSTRISIGLPITMEARDIDNDCSPVPTFDLQYKEAQLLIDELWDCGLRPSEGSGSAGSLAATQKHLEDMRKIAFEKLNISPCDSRLFYQKPNED